MQCLRCHQDNPPQAKFCLECATPLARACIHCGAQLPAAAKFCIACAQPAAIAGEPRFEPPPVLTPPHLAERIRTSRSSLEGERKQVTVLFADLKGSTELIRDLDPEDAQTLLDGALRRIMDAVHRFEGTVNQVMGDGIMALFGAPLAHEDHAVRACYAALAMGQALRQYGEDVRRRHALALDFRVGLNSGEVVVRAIANDLQMDYSAVGQTVHLAARMEQIAPPGGIVLAPATLALTEGFVQVRSLGLVPIRGLDASLEVYELFGAGVARTRLQAAAGRGLSRLVGRQAELEALYRALEQAATGQGQLFALVGEPGVGKSRLVWEVTHSHRLQGTAHDPAAPGWLVLESGSVSYGKATAYRPVIDLLRSYCRVESRDDSRTVREKLAGKILMLDRGLEPTLSPLLALLDAPVDDPVWDALEPVQRRRLTLDALKRVLLRESREQPLLLVFEDLHWIDPETQACLDALVDGLTASRVLLLVNYRPEYAHGWGGKTYYTQLRVDPLSLASTDELLTGLLGDNAALTPLKALLAERTEGNPFFLEESVRTLIEMRMLVGEAGAYDLARPIGDIRVPPTVQAVLSARIDRLAPEEKRLLQMAAVIGKDVPDALLRAVTDGEDHEFQRGLAVLKAGEFLYEASLFPELEYTFKHALTHEVTYGSLLHERRRLGHARVVDAIERVHPGRLAEQIERLAHHALRGERWEQAVTYARQAGARSVERSAYAEAAVWLEQGLDALGHLPERRDRLEAGIDLRLELRQSLHALGQYPQMLALLRQAEAAAVLLGEQRRLGWISAYMVDCRRVLGYEETVEAGRRALTIARACADIRLEIVANTLLTPVYTDRGDYRQAVENLRWLASALQGDLVRQRFGMAVYPGIYASARLAECLAELGAFDEVMVQEAEAVRIAEAIGDPYNRVVTARWLSCVHLRRGDSLRAIAVSEQGLELCRQWDFPTRKPFFTARLGAAYTLARRVADGVRLLEQAEEQARSIGLQVESALRATWLGEAYLAADLIPEATEVAERALALATEEEDHGQRAWTLWLLGEIGARHNARDREAAEAQYRQALTLAEALGRRPLQAHCHLGLGKLYLRAGQRDQARGELSSAIELYRSMQMPLWLPEAEAELARNKGL